MHHSIAIALLVFALPFAVAFACQALGLMPSEAELAAGPPAERVVWVVPASASDISPRPVIVRSRPLPVGLVLRGGWLVVEPPADAAERLYRIRHSPIRDPDASD